MLWLESGRPWSNYFMFHDIVEMLYWVDDRYRAEWDQGLSLHPRDALAIHDQLTKPIPETTWSEMISRSPVNKLSWKFPAAALDDPTSGVRRVLGLHP